MNRWSDLPQEERDALDAEQMEIELESLDLGIKRYREWKRAAQRSQGTPEQRLIGLAIDKVSAAIRNERQAVLEKQAGRGVAHWGYTIFCLPEDKLAALALIAMMNSGGQAVYSDITQLCRNIGAAVEQEYEFDRFKQDHRKLYNVVKRRIKNWTPRQVQHMRKKVNDLSERWPVKVRHWTGFKLLDLCLEYAGLFEHKTYTVSGANGKPKSCSKVEIKPDVLAELEQQHSQCEILRPYWLPMVRPPFDWSNEEQGGFRYHKYPLVKPQNHTEKPEEIPEMGSTVLDAVNYLQGVGWRVNDRVLEVMTQVWKAGGGYAGLPPASPLPIPEKPDNFLTDEEAKIEWKTTARKTHDFNARMISKRKSALTKIRTAHSYRDQDEFFFPYQLDYRSRVYPVAGDLNPQGDDVARGLLEYSVGKELGEVGMYWLKVRLANCFGVDKVSFDARVQWTHAHREHIMRVAEDPFACKWWLEAEEDDPWQALATIFELAKAWDDPEYVSYLPVYMDGSCNGLQHFSALLLDEEAGRLVNLLPSSEPCDIYSEVADSVRDRVRQDQQEIPAEAEDPHPCHSWATDNITRHVVKRGTMTLPYGLTQSGMADQFIQDKWTDGMEKPRSAACYLRDVTWEALTDAVTSARLVMDWLKDIARIAAKDGHPLSWTTPAGFPVTQNALKYKDSAIYTLRQRVNLWLAEPGVLSAHRQQRCMPPNFVHSLDAAHLMLTVCKFMRQGERNISTVHDSYGTHACDVPYMHRAIRTSFFAMHYKPLLEQYHQQWCRALGQELPPPPERGNLELGLVLYSNYFFS